jgi:hypothetical protein
MNENVKQLTRAATATFLAKDWPSAIELLRRALALDLPRDVRFKLTRDLAAAIQFNADGRPRDLLQAIALYEELLGQSVPATADWFSLHRRLGSAWSRLAAVASEVQRESAWKNVISYYERAATDVHQSAVLRASIDTAVGDAYAALRDVDPSNAGRAVKYLSQARQVFVEFGLVEEIEQTTRSLQSLSAVTSAHSTALQASVEAGDVAGARELLECGADPDVCDSDQCSVLQRAASEGYLEIAKLLIRYCANRLHRDNDDFTLLHWAVFSNDPHILELGYVHALGVDPVDVDGRTPLTWAASEDWLESMKWLLARSATTNFADNDGWTALHYAVASGRSIALRTLLSAGADRYLQSKIGETPRDLAQRLQQHEALQILTESSA